MHTWAIQNNDHLCKTKGHSHRQGYLRSTKHFIVPVAESLNVPLWFLIKNISSLLFECNRDALIYLRVCIYNFLCCNFQKDNCILHIFLCMLLG